MRTRTSTEQARSIAAWLHGRLPEQWSATPPEVVVDKDEVVVTLTLEPVDAGPVGAGQDDAGQDDAGQDDAEQDDDAATALAQAEAGRIAAFRSETRETRIAIAREAEHRFGRTLSWAARCGSSRELFTHLAVPVMTRLRQPERVVLDTLVEAGVARSRSHALAWCVQLVGRNADDWLGELQDALAHVRRVREQGPGPGQRPAAG